MRINTNNIQKSVLFFGCLAVVASSFAVNNACHAQDTDSDGIQDQLEHRILDIYRPWLYYDGNEDVWHLHAPAQFQALLSIQQQMRMIGCHTVIQQPNLVLLDVLPQLLSITVPVTSEPEQIFAVMASMGDV